MTDSRSVRVGSLIGNLSSDAVGDTYVLIGGRSAFQFSSVVSIS